MANNEIYNLWVAKATGDAELSEELLRIKHDPEAIEDRFYKELEFGTGGLRGVIGAGSNRMNIYTVGRATQGLSEYIKSKFEKPSVAIAYDSRKNSQLFAFDAAGVFAANGIMVHIFEELKPTPMLSYAVRKLKCSAGIVITASHNPAKYNGYKVYGADGCQITLAAAEEIISYINAADYFSGVKTEPLQDALKNGRVKYIKKSVEDAYFKEVKNCSVFPGVKHTSLRVAYTPLNGAGSKPVRRILEMVGVHDVDIVKEQENPDPAFTTCPYPNPENAKALKLGLELAERTGADIVLGTDPDCDRVGAAVLHDGRYVLLSGNQTGALLLDFICRMRIKRGKMPKNPLAIKTIVTTELIQAIAQSYGVELKNVLTGFKFIGEVIGGLEAKGEVSRFIFGLEESYGYLSGAYARDKDAVNASMLICEMAAYYKKRGKTLVDALDEIYAEHGSFFDRLESTEYEGAQGMRDMAGIMDALRADAPREIGGLKVAEFTDYLSGRRVGRTGEAKTELPSSNVLGFALEGGSSVIVRPSGTEPKLKVYYSLRAENMDECEKLYKLASKSMAEFLKK